MKHIYLIPVLALAAMAVLAQEARVMNAHDMKWGNAPPAFPRGAQVSVLHGDPSRAGPFSMRARFPAGYTMPPHFHTNDENLTVMSGALHVGMGDSMDRRNAYPLNAGGFHHLPGGTHHYAFTRDPTELQISGNGPFDMNYLNPADDPRNRR